MNRLVLIGNGFDLAHGLPTGYEHFIDWYWEKWGERLLRSHAVFEEDELCSFELKKNSGARDFFNFFHFNYYKLDPLNPWKAKEVIDCIKTKSECFSFKIKSELLEKICKQSKLKHWVAIEDIYYSILKKSNDPKPVNDDLEFVKNKLIEYLADVQTCRITRNIIKPIILEQIQAPISKNDVAIGSMGKWNDMLKCRMKYDEKDWIELIKWYNRDNNKPYSYREVEHFKTAFGDDILSENFGVVDAESCPTFRLPNNIMLLNFNYTNTAEMYLIENGTFVVNHIHGELSDQESVIFGYGDERDVNYNELVNKNENEFLQHIKSFRYLDASNYRTMLAFIESDPYQLCIMGHSCGISDRTLLSTLFEHPNCVSIKPYFYLKDGKDDYHKLVWNISRSFSDPRLMRDRVVRKSQCQPLGGVL